MQRKRKSITFMDGNSCAPDDAWAPAKKGRKDDTFNDAERAQSVMYIEHAKRELREDRPIEHMPNVMWDDGGICESLRKTDVAMHNKEMQHLRPDDAWQEMRDEIFRAASRVTDYIVLMQTKINQQKMEISELQKILGHNVFRVDGY